MRENMRPDTAEVAAWRLADRQARAELSPEFDRRVAAVQAAGGGAVELLAVVEWMNASVAARTAEIGGATFPACIVSAPRVP